MDNYHITHEKGKWKLKREEYPRTIQISNTKEDAIKKMRQYMCNKIGSVKIHKVDGKIQEERTYPRSKDPRRTKG